MSPSLFWCTITLPTERCKTYLKLGQLELIRTCRRRHDGDNHLEKRGGGYLEGVLCSVYIEEVVILVMRLVSLIHS